MFNKWDRWNPPSRVSLLIIPVQSIRPKVITECVDVNCYRMGFKIDIWIKDNFHSGRPTQFLFLF